MRYIASSDGCIKNISFGATIVCDGASCTEYIGSVPLGYGSLEEWYLAESEALYRWKIVNGNLTLNEDAEAPDAECSWITTVNSHIEDMNNPHGVTKEQIGALGYKYTLTANDDLDDVKEDGIYVYTTANRPANAPFANAAVVMVFGSKQASSQKVQIAFRYGVAGYAKFRVLYNSWLEWADFNATFESTDYSGCHYRIVDGETEWVNPPMVLGVEYRTTERYNGKPVYIKAISVALKDNGETKEQYSGSAVTPIDCRVYVSKVTGTSTTTQMLPFITSTGELRTSLQVSAYNVIITTHSTLSGYSGVATVKYIKD